ncbi:MAG TPA: L-2-amino-thiazoline-4-carboxylic acid hydrolase [Firmicutes bacterium]|nr:L-2-amino-thiazoline-4-carboxylic acid hydrolase [Candidatus Fermentithermobacillaceae bacterium]
MYTYEQKCMMNLSDAYTMLYGFIVQSVLDRFGEEGERWVREGTRRFGRDRALTSRELHLAAGAKINMQNLFGLYHDLPSDPRFRRKKQELNPQERVSHTLICPMAEVWKEYGHMAIGRIYCEEFHNSCYSSYAFGYTQVNLAKTLTQEGDDHCAFNVVLRPENLPEDLRPVCFEEYDPEYVEPDLPPRPVDGKAGFNTLSIKLYYYLLEAVSEGLGEAGAHAIEEGLEELARKTADRLKACAEEDNLTIDRRYVEDNHPLRVEIDAEPMWEKYSKHEAKQRMEQHFYKVFHRELSLVCDR